MTAEGQGGASAPPDLFDDRVHREVERRLDRVDARLQMLLNGISDLAARLPAMEREAREIRAALNPDLKEEG